MIQALRYMKKININKDMVARLIKVLGPATKKDLINNLRIVPAWLIPVVKEIAGVK